MTIVTTIYLEMTDVSQLRAKPCDDSRFRVLEATENQWQMNRSLYETIGANCAWRDKLSWSDNQWRCYVDDDNLRTFIAYYDGDVAGYFELFKQGQQVQIAYFGLTPGFIGRGFGGALLTRALEQAWKTDPERVWVHTCNLDHEAALANYLARGMAIYKTET